MKDFVIDTPVWLYTKPYTIASATVIELWDIVALDASNLVIKATAASTKIAYAVQKSDVWDTEILLAVDWDLVLKWTWDAVFANSMKWITCDLVVTTWKQYVDVWASATDVFKIISSADAWTVWSAENIKVKINAPLF